MNIDNLNKAAPDRPLVSVAVVTYNQKEFLKECIESILIQDYPNIEIVVADDGSTDGTDQLLRAYQQEAKRPFVLRMAEKNQGVTRNQNAAVFACSGKYISWMAGDDLMLPGKISKQVEFLENNPDYSICYHDLDIFDSRTNQTIKKFSQTDKPRVGDLATLVKYGSFNGAVSNMVRRSSSPKNGFDPRIPVASDWLYFVECLWSGGKIGYVNEVLARHRRHDNNVTSSSIKRPSLTGIQDHLFSCEVIASRAPWMVKEINGRKANLFLSLRWMDNGKFYGSYLRASLIYKFRLKVFVGLLAYSLFGMRR
ncbi:glycosyltransferase [Polaromonas sp.]|uniref:glycosyltransferase family 2 protein n=1 Tax=Polaromonas sp. TaxID=1869339 RepID=UPI00286D5342|nr:glycosyltransferase [Polaromonas sp.]